MAKQEPIKRLDALDKEAKELRAIIEAPEKTKEQRFKELIEGIDVNKPVVDFGKYPNSIFWMFPNGDFGFKYNFKSGDMWVDYSKIWKIFHDEFSMDYEATIAFMKVQIEEVFKLKGITPDTGIQVSADFDRIGISN